MVKLNSVDIAKYAEDAVRKTLTGIPFLEIASVGRENGVNGGTEDLVARVRTPQAEWVLIFETKPRGEPKLARAAVNQLLQSRQRYENAYGIFVAPYVSSRAAELCRAEGVGYLDLSGNCRLSFGSVFVEREGQPNRFAEKRDMRTLYSPKASRLLRMLLTEPRRAWTVIDLAKEADVSLGLVSNVKRFLEDREWAKKGSSGIVLTQAEALFMEWSRNYSFQKNKAYDYYSPMSTSKVESDLAQVCANREVRYELTAFSSAVRIAPMVRYQRVFAYIDSALQEVVHELDLKEVTSGPNVTLLQPYDPGVFFGARQLEGVWAASPIQTYLDLIGLKGRGDEAAKEILEEAIRPQW